MKKQKEYALLIISLHNQSGKAADALTNTLLRKFSKINKSKLPGTTVSVDSNDQGGGKLGSWSFNIVTTKTIKQCTIQEFMIPKSQGLSLGAFTFWTSGAVVRSIKYLIFKTKDIWENASSINHKLLNIPRIIWTTFTTIFDTIFFYYFIPIMFINVIRFLRKISLITYISFFLLMFFSILLVNWENKLIPFIQWVSQITHTIVDSLNDGQLTFPILFPVICSTVFGTVIASFIVLGRGIQWIFRRLDNSFEQASLRIVDEYSYLLDPLYSAKLKGDFERQIIGLNDMPNVERIFIVCEKAGILLAYEVLSRICPEKISKPVYLLTRDFSLAGLIASPERSLWLLVSPSEWNRFSMPTPRNLRWFHFSKRLPCTEFKLEISKTPHRSIPSVKTHFRKRYWLKGRSAALIDSLSTLIRN